MQCSCRMHYIAFPQMIGGKKVKAIKRLSDWSDKVSRHAVTILFVWMTLVLFIQVGGRYLFSSGLVWTEEMARYTMVWIVFLGAAVATKDDSQIRISTLEDNVPSLKRYLKPVQNVLLIVYLFLIIFLSWDTLQTVYAQKAVNTGISMGVIYSIIPLSFIMMFFHVLTQFKTEEKGER